MVAALLSRSRHQCTTITIADNDLVGATRALGAGHVRYTHSTNGASRGSAVSSFELRTL
jgi:hypothetical protein